MSERLSPHFTLLEMTTTQVRGIDNTPGPHELRNLKRLCRTVLEPLRRQFGPYYISSGYRAPAINRVIGGSASSRHMDGCAADGAPLGKASWSMVMEYALEHLPVDQAIYEFGRWLHLGIALEGAKPRGQALMIFEPGKYEKWNPKDPRVTR